MRIVIAGFGEVGYRLAEKLMKDHEVLIVEKDLEKIRKASQLDVAVVRGNAANLLTLKKVEVSKADIFLAVTGNDEVNMLSGLIAKRLGVPKVIVRVENPEYVDKPLVKNHPFGYDAMICPQLALASEIAKILSTPGAVDVVTLSGGKVDMVELIVMQSSDADGKRIEEMNLPKNVIITTVYRNGEVIIPKGDFVLRSGDKIVLVGKSEEIENLTSIFGAAVVKKVAIFGAGTVGSYVAKILSKGPMKIKLFDLDPERCSLMSEELRNVKIVCGDFTEVKLLKDEEIGSSDAIVAATESDEINLATCLVSKSLGAKKAIAKVEKTEYVDLFETVGIDAFCPKTVMFNETLKLLKLEGVETLVEFGKVVVIEVKNQTLKKKIEDLKLPKNVMIGAVIRGEECLIPRGDTEILPGDSLIVLTEWSEVEEVEKVFK
ncbi:MAG: Trk system potassium transporter TrkA [Archaeoglobaceae archaeon]|nr:Trk system potassium transporter TrkA [Archaeoglobaceae archaeon]MCX8151908.1 Trk system potassium transporter TrkA [Archaeoglobaceae archaeon]MDW8013297.1 Trk system potassium transporter TrkA [Archaeoglobaceae archaeon]